MAYILWWFPKLSETFVVEELLALDRRGVHPLIFARERPDERIINDAADPLLARTTWLRKAGRGAEVRSVAAAVTKHPLRTFGCAAFVLRKARRGLAVNLWFALVLVRELERTDVRYLHAHFGDNAAELAMFASRITGIPWGATFHGVDIYVGRALCDKLRGASLHVTVCEYNVAQLVARCTQIPADRYMVKFAGLDTSRFTRTRPLRSGHARELVAVGRLTAKKGFLSLVDAVAEVRRRGVDVHCTIIGDGEQRDELQAAIDRLGLAGTVVITGPAAPSGVRDALEEADALVAPCTIAANGDRDSMPVTIKEAMAMELPVIASDDFGIPEMVPPDAGVLVPRDDVGALADAIVHVLGLPPDERARMGRSGRAAVVERFDEDICVVPLVAAFESLLARR